MDAIELTEAARGYFHELCSFTGERTILLSVNSKGCGGHSYQLAFAPDYAGEVVDLGDGYRLVIEPRSLLWLVGTQVDYRDDGLDQQVVFNNPLETGRCGCGSSFTTNGGCR